MKRDVTSTVASPRRRALTLSAAAAVVLALVAGACGSTRAGHPATSGGGTPSPSPPASAPASHPGGGSTPSPSARPSEPAGTWQLLPAAPVTQMPYNLVSVWTGHEMIIHGTTSTGKFEGVTFAYDPAANTWTALPRGPKPMTLEGADHVVWTGSEMIVLGPPTLGAYNPAANTWRTIPIGGPNEGAVVGWTGHEAIVWGGVCCAGLNNNGQAYNPATNTWRTLPTAPLERRRDSMGAWTGKELVVAGGVAGVPGGRMLNTAAAYNPVTNTWRTLPPMPRHRARGTGLWDGREVLLLGPWQRGMAYNPATKTWRMLPVMPYSRDGFVAVWTGRQVLVWGGLSGHFGAWVIPPHGEAYDPAANRWSPLPMAPLHGREFPTGVWTGHQMIVWGGDIPGAIKNTNFLDGAAFQPSTP